MFGRRHRAFRRASWLALFAILLQTLVPVPPPPANAARAGSASFEGANLCMAPGSIPAGPASTDDKAPAHKAPPCAICQSVQMLAAGFVPSAAASFGLPSDPGHARAAIPGPQVRERLAATGARARAPPVKA